MIRNIPKTLLSYLLFVFLTIQYTEAQTINEPNEHAKTTVARLTRSFVHSLYFPLDKDDVYEDYMDNPKTLRLFRQKVDSIGVENIDSVNIVVQSSPEGRTAYNFDLSKRRAFKTERYFAKKFADIMPVTHVFADGESWQTLRRFILTDPTMSEDEIRTAVNVIDDDRDIEKRKATFMALPTYAYIYRTYFPRLRNTLIATIYSTTVISTKDVPERVIVKEKEPIVLRDTVYVNHYTVINNIINNYEKEIVWTENDSIMRHPLFALKTNLLFDLATFLNGEVEVPVGKRWSLMAEVTWPWWLQKSHNKWCIEMGEVGLEGRYWFHSWKRHSNYRKWCEEKNMPLVGFFMGLYANAAYYDFQLHRDRGTQGEFIGAGLTFGYSKLLSRHWRMEFSLGVGASQNWYRKYHIEENTDVIPDRDQHLWRDTPKGEDLKKLWIGPTKAKISISWLLFGKCKKGGGL